LSNIPNGSSSHFYLPDSATALRFAIVSTDLIISRPKVPDVANAIHVERIQQDALLGTVGTVAIPLRRLFRAPESLNGHILGW
jgi:hypothetical protein